jgi:hypothetical protein
MVAGEVLSILIQGDPSASQGRAEVWGTIAFLPSSFIWCVSRILNLRSFWHFKLSIAV